MGNGNGFQIMYEAVNQTTSTTTSSTTTTTNIKYKDCGGNFTAPHGFITSPLYPENYPNNAECTYVITQPTGKYVNLTIFYLDLQYDEDWMTGWVFCPDNLSIRDGESQSSESLAGYICGNETVTSINETSIISSNNNVRLR